MLKEKLYKAVMSHAQGNIDKAVANVEVYMNNPVGVADHSDIVGEIIKELKVINSNQEIKDTLEKHFGADKVNLNG
tara:strand:+ start:29 stop:256 length:228 start_codon:yes stop_codon:yes gene_type:complete